MASSSKNTAAVALGKLGASKGGKARAATLSQRRLSEIGQKGGIASGKARKARANAKKLAIDMPA